jgi:hypothetical protein
MSSAPKVSAETSSGLVDDHDPNDLGQKLANKETLPQGYDAQRGGTTSGQMDESKPSSRRQRRAAQARPAI